MQPEQSSSASRAKAQIDQLQKRLNYLQFRQNIRNEVSILENGGAEPMTSEEKRLYFRQRLIVENGIGTERQERIRNKMKKAKTKIKSEAEISAIRPELSTQDSHVTVESDIESQEYIALKKIFDWYQKARLSNYMILKNYLIQEQIKASQSLDQNHIVRDDVLLQMTAIFPHEGLVRRFNETVCLSSAEITKLIEMLDTAEQIEIDQINRNLQLVEQLFQDKSTMLGCIIEGDSVYTFRKTTGFVIIPTDASDVNSLMYRNYADEHKVYADKIFKTLALFNRTNIVPSTPGCIFPQGLPLSNIMSSLDVFPESTTLSKLNVLFEDNIDAKTKIFKIPLTQGLNPNLKRVKVLYDTLFEWQKNGAEDNPASALFVFGSVVDSLLHDSHVSKQELADKLGPNKTSAELITQVYEFLSVRLRG